MSANTSLKFTGLSPFSAEKEADGKILVYSALIREAKWKSI
jgi:hypothetical protein